MALRNEFWETQPAYGGRGETWAALRAVADAVLAGEADTANALAEAAGVTFVPRSRDVLAAGPTRTPGPQPEDTFAFYDSAGCRYEVPRYCLAASQAGPASGPAPRPDAIAALRLPAGVVAPNYYPEAA